MCHSRHHHRRPAERLEDPGFRASDREREDTVAMLREHQAAGRLDVDELEERVGAAYAARTRGDLTALLRDLPSSLPARPRPVAPMRHGHPHRHGWLAFGQVSAILIAVWALSGADFFWPAWVMVWWGLALVMKSAPGLLRTR
jgi:hypothetical protein